ncbi:hypothetical protein SELMODRAFT_426625 [Selaginella moellendorffii]|uniref:Uncharacterized protein n=1 Tax=Selaginella moellendorffii TaxID=88036 RepID=D8SWZ3_SELML|nr:hypothetical protein SELMODRAFT_426625 [Selaginella moellendorffii]
MDSIAAMRNVLRKVVEARIEHLRSGLEYEGEMMKSNPSKKAGGCARSGWKNSAAELKDLEQVGSASSPFYCLHSTYGGHQNAFSAHLHVILYLGKTQTSLRFAFLADLVL